LDPIPELLGKDRAAGGRVSYCDDDEEDHTVVYLGEPISSGYVLIPDDHLGKLTSLEHARWEREHRNFCRKTGIK
jgi:hypothetical protein